MLDSDFDELLDEYINGTISDKDFLAMVAHSSISTRCKQKFEEAERMLELTSDKLLDKSKIHFRVKLREFLEDTKSKMRRAQAKGNFITRGFPYFLVFLLLLFIGTYPHLYIKKITFKLMITFFQIVSVIVISFLSVYVFFFKGKD